MGTFLYELLMLIFIGIGLCVIAHFQEKRASQLGLCLDCDKPIKRLSTIEHPKKWCECGGFAVYPQPCK